MFLQESVQEELFRGNDSGRGRGRGRGGGRVATSMRLQLG
eukprot:COSAG02_NODE_1943_length_10309_cov_29.284721_5_plen_40_part_00